MINKLIKIFIKNSDDIKDAKVRNSYGIFAGIFGIITNIIISSMKIIIGVISSSLAIISDGIDNLSDACSSVITIIGFKLSSKPADEEHPYGHERLEYVTGLIVSFVILMVGLSLFKMSIEKIIKPTEVKFSYITIIILLVSIGVKIWQGSTYLKLSKKIDSLALKATSKDSFNDVLSTLMVLLSVLIYRFTSYNVDGYFGLIVSIFIIKAGIDLIKDTISPLISEKVDPEFIKKIVEEIKGFDGVLGVHDLLYHSYGANKIYMSLHVEVPEDVKITISHDIIDNIEKYIKDTYNVELVIHMDPIDNKGSETIKFRDLTEEYLKEADESLSFHDFRIVKGETHTNLIFDVLVPVDFKYKNSEIKELIESKFKLNGYSDVNVVITFDIQYIKE